MLTIKVLPNVYQLMTTGVNVSIIAEEELTLIDAGVPTSLPRILDAIHHLGRSVEEVGTIIITHNHFDHIGTVPELRQLSGARVIAHGADLVDAPSQTPYPGGVRRLLRVPFLHRVRRRFVLEPDDVDVHLTGGEILEPLGGLQVIHTPGHTPGSITLYSPERRLAFVGDAMRRRRKALDLPAKAVSTDLELSVESLKRIAGLDFDTLVFGHGRPLRRVAHRWLEALMERGGG